MASRGLYSGDAEVAENGKCNGYATAARFVPKNAGRTGRYKFKSNVKGWRSDDRRYKCKGVGCDR